MDSVALVMAALVILIAGVIAFPIIAARRRRGFGTEPSVKVRDVPALVEGFLRQDPKDGSYIVFLTNDSGEDDGAGFAQVSIEDGLAGVDHVFTSDQNRRTAAQFELLAKQVGATVHRLTHNDIEYLRVQVQEPQVLVREVLLSVLGRRDDQRVDVIREVVRT